MQVDVLFIDPMALDDLLLTCFNQCRGQWFLIWDFQPFLEVQKSLTIRFKKKQICQNELIKTGVVYSRISQEKNTSPPKKKSSSQPMFTVCILLVRIYEGTKVIGMSGHFSSGFRGEKHYNQTVLIRVLIFEIVRRDGSS